MLSNVDWIIKADKVQDMFDIFEKNLISVVNTLAPIIKFANNTMRKQKFTRQHQE